MNINNRKPDEELISELRLEIEQLRAELVVSVDKIDKRCARARVTLSLVRKELDIVGDELEHMIDKHRG